MHDLTLDFSLSFLLNSITCGKCIRHILGILMVLHHDYISSYHYSFFSCICYTISNEWYIFTCYCKKNVTIICIFLCRLQTLICMRHAIIKPNVVGRVNFTISYARDTHFCNLISFDTSPSIPFSSHFPQFLPLHIVSPLKGEQFVSVIVVLLFSFLQFCKSI